MKILEYIEIFHDQQKFTSKKRNYSTTKKIYNNLETFLQKYYIIYSIHEWPDSPTPTG